MDAYISKQYTIYGRNARNGDRVRNSKPKLKFYSLRGRQKKLLYNELQVTVILNAILNHIFGQ